MKKSIVLTVGLMMGCIVPCRGDGGVVLSSDRLVLSIEPSTLPFTSESVPFQVVFTNTSDSTFTILEPVLGRDLVIRVFDKEGQELARSVNNIEYRNRYRGNRPGENKEYIQLKPREAWKTEILDLFVHVRPSFRITPDQTVSIVVKYTLTEVGVKREEEKEYEAKISVDIPARDMEVKRGYISSDEALALAERELRINPDKWSKVKDITPTVQCINGTYRITYPRDWPPKMRGPTYIYKIVIDAHTGKILSVSMGG